MKFLEVKGDLFKVSNEHVLVHCISADCKMGAGIAVEFVKRYPSMRNLVLSMKPEVGQALYYNGANKRFVINLITKERYYHKPTRDNFNKTILDMKRVIDFYNIQKIALPLIGSGLDRLNWDESSKFIQETFVDTDIEILVVKL